MDACKARLGVRWKGGRWGAGTRAPTSTSIDTSTVGCRRLKPAGRALSPGRATSWAGSSPGRPCRASSRAGTACTSRRPRGRPAGREGERAASLAGRREIAAQPHPAEAPPKQVCLIRRAPIGRRRRGAARTTHQSSGAGHTQLAVGDQLAAQVALLGAPEVAKGAGLAAPLAAGRARRRVASGGAGGGQSRPCTSRQALCGLSFRTPQVTTALDHRLPLTC